MNESHTGQAGASFYHFDDFDAAIDAQHSGTSAWGYVIGAIALIASIGGAVYFAYEQGVNDTLQTSTPVIRKSDEAVFLVPQRAGLEDANEREVFDHLRRNHRDADDAPNTKPLVVQLLAKKLEIAKLDHANRSMMLSSQGSNLTTSAISPADKIDTGAGSGSASSALVAENNLAGQNRQQEAESSTAGMTAMATIAGAQEQTPSIDLSKALSGSEVVIQPMDGGGGTIVGAARGGIDGESAQGGGGTTIGDAITAVGSLGSQAPSQPDNSLNTSSTSRSASNASASQGFASQPMESEMTTARLSSDSRERSRTDQIDIVQYVAQVATLGSREAALQEWGDVVRRNRVLAGSEPIINISSFSSGRPAYQLRIGPYDSSSEARRMCDALLASGERDCAVRRY